MCEKSCKINKITSFRTENHPSGVRAEVDVFPMLKLRKTTFEETRQMTDVFCKQTGRMKSGILYLNEEGNSMKKRFGRMLGILFTMVMLVGLMPATAMAADELTAITNVTATSDDMESISKFNGLRKDPEIEVTEGDRDSYRLFCYNHPFAEGIHPGWVITNSGYICTITHI